jgi:uncharacterized membrane protein
MPVSSLHRIRSVDVVRGLVCVLMAIDHVRVYSGVPAGGASAGVFLTRWVTHFVAPAFCFFAGTAAFFLGARLKDTAALRRFLITRGLLLVFLELTLIRYLWSFNPDLTAFSLAGVIWMLGWCMVLLGLVVGLPAGVVGWAGVAIVAVQQIFGIPPRLLGAIAPVWAYIYPSGSEAALGVNVLYVIVPWVGVMMAGYGFGCLWDREEDDRDRLFLRLGLAMTAVFLVGAMVQVLMAGDSGGDVAAAPLWVSILNQQKYPASQLFLLMTLGPAIAILPAAEKLKGAPGRMLETFGRVPMWYYLWHILVIHVAALIVMRIRIGGWHNDWFAIAPFTQVPQGARWSLALLWAIWAVCIAVLYPICRWYERRKAGNPAMWMRYL